MFAISLTVTASFFGVMAIAWAQVVISIFAYFMNTHYTKVLLGYSGWRQLSDLTVNFVAVIPMAAVIFLIADTLQAAAFVKLIVASIIGGAVYLLTCRMLCKNLLNECLSLSGLQKRAASLQE